MHPQKQLVASGETGKNPSICIWDSVALKTVSVLAMVSLKISFLLAVYNISFSFIYKQLKLDTLFLVKEDSHTHGIGALAFSDCGGRLLSVGVDPKSLVSIWDWESARQLCIGLDFSL